MMMTPAKSGSLKVKVNGYEWKEVQSLADSTAKDRHYVVDQATGRISFGDGLTGRKPPKGARIAVSYRTGSGAVAIPTGKMCGIYRGVVINNLDPLARFRLQVDVPDAGITSLWAAACLPTGAVTLPKVGAVVWISFEGGEASSPVWLGVTAS